VERKVALGARTNVEIDIMNTKHADGYRIVKRGPAGPGLPHGLDHLLPGAGGQARARPAAARLEAIRTARFLDSDENGSRYTLLGGVHLIWKRCHSWGNVIGEHTLVQPPAGATGFTPTPTWV